MFKDMNLPNKLTILRIMLVPIFVILLNFSFGDIKYLKYIALAIFIIATITDYIDGYISRKYNLVTQFGKIMDPVADKLLISSGFIMLTAVGIIPALVTVLIIFRDFFVNGMRMIAINKQDVSADIAGKIKTVFCFLTVILGILDVSKSGFLGFLNSSVYIMSVPTLFINILFSVSIIAVVISTVITIITYTKKYMKDSI
ncbi:MAG: CDP-diacylglycerol--glycerol-3-phosphate 3-phosphatidyltransferase [Clostridia bacterium]